MLSDRFLALRTLSALIDILMMDYKDQMTPRELLCLMNLWSKWGG